jgi:hypothetical protein
MATVCRGDNLEPKLRDIVLSNAVIVKNSLGLLGKRYEMETNVNNQDVSANSHVQDSACKRSKNVDVDQSSLHLTGPHGKARQEQ